MASSNNVSSLSPYHRGRSRPTLTAYVRQRNGVALGASGSLSAMLSRSLGASSFQKFWNHWNPIWGYYLGYRVFKPLADRLPDPMALLGTFAVSGVLHDAAVSLFRMNLTVIFTPWFTLMGVLVLVSTALNFRYESTWWLNRAGLNLFQLVATFLLVRWLMAP
ncbi:MAG: hypothetical protein ABJ013_15385 [Halioglobus sp.]